MNRREALSAVSMIFGGTIVGSAGFLNGCQPRERKSIFGALDQKQMTLLEELAEIILPKSADSPGAKDVEIGKFINSIVTDCYAETEQQAFLAGIAKVDELARQSFGGKLTKLGPGDKQRLVEQLEKESLTHNRSNTDPPHFYTMMKQLFVWGFLSSELVGTAVLRHVPIPGRYEGCVPYASGEKAYI
jgi:hypothetical protein